MRQEEYAALRRAKSPRFTGHQAIAKAELAFGHAVEHRRDAAGLSYGDLAQATGIDAERLEAIEAGDSASLAEVLWLCHELRMEVAIDADFNVRSVPKVDLHAAVGVG